MLQLFMAIALGWSTFAAQLYPIGPDPQLSPGSYCTHPDEYRYPEHIPYCERNVSKHTKWDVINSYNEKFHYDIGRGDRDQFKIDHLIPLCAGGSNEVHNLWPQHESVYKITDPLEDIACQKMAEGHLLQKRAVELLIQAKMHLEQVPQILALLQAL